MGAEKGSTACGARGRWDGSRRASVACCTRAVGWEPKSGKLRVLREGGGMVNEKRATVCCARDSFEMERFV